MKSGRPGPAPDAHRYTLWRLPAYEFIISMGEHGQMVVTQHPAPGGMSQIDVSKHNLAERSRAREEGTKWEMRLRGSPLGKTQQDFVAYYAEVEALFSEWRDSRGTTLPSP